MPHCQAIHLRLCSAAAPAAVRTRRLDWSQHSTAARRILPPARLPDHLIDPNAVSSPQVKRHVCCAQTADKFQIKADIPGVTKQDIKLNVDGDVLSLSVQKAEQKQVRRHDSCHRQLHIGSAERLQHPPSLAARCYAVGRGVPSADCRQAQPLRCTCCTALSVSSSIQRSGISCNEWPL